MTLPDIDHFLAHTTPEPMSGCWLWLGGHGRHYGLWPLSPTTYEAAHRVAYKLFVGPIPEGLVLDHLCSTTLCVNPAHLEPVTITENNRRRRNSEAMRTACVNGHEFDESNTRIVKTAKGEKRACKTCDVERHRVWRAKRKQAGLIQTVVDTVGLTAVGS